MVSLVKIVGKETYTDTLIMSTGFDIKHNAILKLVLKYKERLERKGTLSREIQKSGGRPTTFYFLNESQALFIASLMRNSDKVVDFKDKLSDEFVRQKTVLQNIIINQKNSEWLEKRKQGKESRRVETDAIKTYVDYAKSQGSKNADKYFLLLTNAEYRALFFLEQKFKNVRDVLEGHQLETIANADRIVARQLLRCVEEGRPYKEGYKMANDAVKAFAELIGKSIVPLMNQKQLTKG